MERTVPFSIASVLSVAGLIFSSIEVLSSFDDVSGSEESERLLLVAKCRFGRLVEICEDFCKLVKYSLIRLLTWFD